MFRVPVDLGVQSKLCLFYFLLVSGRIDPSIIDVVDKPAEIFSNSAVTEAEAAASNVGHDNATEQGDCGNPAVVYAAAAKGNW